MKEETIEDYVRRGRREIEITGREKEEREGEEGKGEERRYPLSPIVNSDLYLVVSSRAEERDNL